MKGNKIHMVGGRWMLAVVGILFAQLSSASYTVWRGCPDFTDLQQPYVESFFGTFNNPFDSIGIVGSRHSLIEHSLTDPNTGGFLSTLPDGEVKSVRLGNEQVGGEAEAIVYHFVVDPSNTLLFVNFAVVMEDPGHDLIFQPRFIVRITDGSGNLVSDCSEYDVSAASGLSGFQDYLGGYTPVRWRDWTKVGLDLTPYANQEVQVQFVTYDCAAMGHFGYAYFTAHCAPNKLSLQECSGERISVSAPDGFSAYLWDNGDTTQITTREFRGEELNLYCEVTSVTGCSFTQNAYISNQNSEQENFFIDTICQGESYEKHHFSLPPQMEYGTKTFTNRFFNPSTCAEQSEIMLELTVLRQYYEFDASICEGEDYLQNGFFIFQPPVGVLFDTLRYVREDQRCDSVVCLKLTISEALQLDNHITGDASPCVGEAVSFYVDGNLTSADFTWEIPGNAKIVSGGNSPSVVLAFMDDRESTVVLKGENGCGSSAVPLKVAPKMAYHLFFKDTACVNQSYDGHGFHLPKLNETGTFTYMLSNRTTSNCDSVVVLSLLVVDQPHVSIEVENDKPLYCSSEKVLLKAKGDGSRYIMHECDPLPIKIGDVYCSDGSFVDVSEYDNRLNNASGVVFYIDTAFRYALVCDLSESFNIAWGGMGIDIAGLYNESQARVILNDMNGYENTSIIRNAGDASIYPAAWSVDYDNGWYVPSIGEMRLLFSSFHEINPSLKIVGGGEFPTNLNYFGSTYSYISSSELSSYYYCAVTHTGEIMGNFKSSTYSRLRAIKRIELAPIPEDGKCKVGDLVKNEYGEEGIAFHLAPDGRSGWMIALDEPLEYKIYDPVIRDIPELANHTDSNYYMISLAAIEDWDGEENTKILRRHIEAGDTIAIWAFDSGKGWFLPSVGQMDEIYSLSPIVDSALAAHGGHAMYFDTYWTSTEIDSLYAWTYDMVFGNPDPYSKNRPFAVRPISRFTYCEPYAEVLDSSLSFVWQNGKASPAIEVNPSETTKYEVIAYNSDGCSASAGKSIYVAQPEMTHIYDTICYGGTYEDEFFKESKSGVYSHTEKVGECEQIFVLHLFAEENLERSYVSDSVCYGGTYSKYGFNIQSSVVGERKDSLLLTNRYGCDSILYLDLTVLPMKRDTLRKSVCKNQSYEDGDFFVPAYQSCGVNFYEKINTDVNTGCVSRLVLELRVDTVYQRSLVDSICLNEIYKRDGFDITATKEGFNNYYRTLSSQNGCDSILALNLKVFDTSETVFFDTIVVGSPYKNFGFDLAPQYSMGMKQYIRHQENENKCDSVITLNLMIVSDEDSLFVPTAFTPQNGNGVNDVFMEGYEIYIYDRYGLLVCHSLNGWDGRYAGKMADAGVYVYTLIYKSGSKKSGTVEIFKE